MAINTRDYLDYLDQEIGIAPANSQEELQAAETIAEAFERHGLETTIQEFDAPSGNKTLIGLLMVLLFCGMLLAGLGGPLALIGALIALACAALLVLDMTGSDLLRKYGPRAKSQNVVASHKATGPLVAKGNRPIVIVAHYDTPHEDLLGRIGLAPYRPLLKRIGAICMPAAGVLSLLQLFVFLPGGLRRILWVIGLIAAIPILVLGIAELFDRFMPCTPGANSNKASVAAMLGVLEMVRPKPELNWASHSSVRNQNRAAEGGAEASYEYVEPELPPTTRHGKEVLQSLGMLPDSCELVYVEAPARPVRSEAAPVVEEAPEQGATPAFLAGVGESASTDQTHVEADYDDNGYVEGELGVDGEYDLERSNPEGELVVEDEYGNEVAYEAGFEGDEYEFETEPKVSPFAAVGEFFRGLLDKIAPANDGEYETDDYVDMPAENTADDSYVDDISAESEIAGDDVYIEDERLETVYVEESFAEEGEPLDNEELAAEAAVEGVLEQELVEATEPELEVIAEQDVELAPDTARELVEVEGEQVEAEFEYDESADAVAYDEGEAADAGLGSFVATPVSAANEALADSAEYVGGKLRQTLDDLRFFLSIPADTPGSYVEEIAPVEFADEVVAEAEINIAENRVIEADDETSLEQDAGEPEKDAAELEQDATEAAAETEQEVAGLTQETPELDVELVEQQELATQDELDEPSVEQEQVDAAELEPIVAAEVQKMSPSTDEGSFGETDTNGLEYTGTEDVPIDSEPVLIEIPEPPAPEDPNWGVSTYQPDNASVARRAALFDLPDPSQDSLDPLYESKDTEVEQDSANTNDAVPEPVRIEATSARNTRPQADNATVDTPDRKRRRLFGRRDRKQTPAENNGSLSEWLGVDEDYDAKSEGRNIGSWDNFNDEDDSWKGGAAPNSQLRLVDEDGESAAPSDEELRSAILGMGDDALISHDIWFVALGSSSLDHAGMRAFLDQFRTACRGSFVINLDGVGAGELTVLTEEGIAPTRQADRRVTRLLSTTAQDLHIDLASASHAWGDTDVTPAMRSSMRSVTITGLDAGGSVAFSGSMDDVPENIIEPQVQDVADLVAEVIRRS